MMKANCRKCGAELLVRDGYCVCNNCGEIYALPAEEVLSEENTQEVLPEEIVEKSAVLEVEETVTSEIQEEVEETEEEIEEEIQEITEEEKVISPVVKTVKKKKSKAPAVIWTMVVIIGVAFACYYTTAHLVMNTDTDTEVFEKDEYAVEEILPEEEPEEIVEEVIFEEAEEPEEEVKEEIKEEIKEEVKEEPKPAPAKKPVQDKKPVVKEPPVTSETPAVAYRIRKSADDSHTQIGAFADIERAKAYAAAHAAEGYKVFDMNGNLVYQP